MDYKKIEEDPEEYGNNLTIKKLEALLRKLSDYYYNTDTSLVDDDTFDILKSILEKKSPKSKFLKEVGAPPKKDKVKLPFPLMSLDKIKEDDALNKYIKKYTGPYVLSDKLDGVSAMIYNNKLYSRGNGVIGQDITNLLEHVTKAKPEKDMAVRGELIITRKDFDKIKDDNSNIRNTVGGIVNSKHPDKNILKLVKFVAYNIITPEYDQLTQFKKLEKIGFKVPKYTVKTKLVDAELKEYLGLRRKESEYDVDGIVIADSSKAYKITSKNPDHAVAYKMINEVFDVKVTDVIWNASKDGYLKPKIKIEPINTQGVKITYVTAHNAKNILDNNIGIGSIVQITRSGDVIPYIVKVITGAKAKMPDIPYVWNKSKVDVIVKDIFTHASDSIKVKQLKHFFTACDIKYISEGILKKIVEEGYDTVYKILSADRKKLVKINGIGEKLVEKIYDSIETNLKKIKLETLMYASNIFGRNLGEKKLKLIVDKYPKILEKKWDKETFIEKLNDIDGFSILTSEKFVDNLDKFKDFMEQISPFIKIHKEEKKESEHTIFTNKTIVFTGFRDKNFEKIITNNGGKVSGSVTSKTFILVYASGSGNKLKKAQELGIKTMTKEEFEEYLTLNKIFFI